MDSAVSLIPLIFSLCLASGVYAFDNVTVAGDAFLELPCNASDLNLLPSQLLVIELSYPNSWQDSWETTTNVDYYLSISPTSGIQPEIHATFDIDKGVSVQYCDYPSQCSYVVLNSSSTNSTDWKVTEMEDKMVVNKTLYILSAKETTVSSVGIMSESACRLVTFQLQAITSPELATTPLLINGDTGSLAGISTSTTPPSSSGFTLTMVIALSILWFLIIAASILALILPTLLTKSALSN